MEKHTTVYGSKYEQKHRKQFAVVFFDKGDSKAVEFVESNGGNPFIKDLLRLIAADQEPFQEFIDKAKESSKGRQRSK